MTIDIRHNEYWPKGRMTIFSANRDDCGCYFGTREDIPLDLKYKDIQYVCINTEDWDETVEWLSKIVMLIDGEPPLVSQ